jgi:hypothetical protein
VGTKRGHGEYGGGRGKKGNMGKRDRERERGEYRTKRKSWGNSTRNREG